MSDGKGRFCDWCHNLDRPVEQSSPYYGYPICRCATGNARRRDAVNVALKAGIIEKLKENGYDARLHPRTGQVAILRDGKWWRVAGGEYERPSLILMREDWCDVHERYSCGCRG